MIITIEKADNGWIMKVAEDELLPYTEVFEAKQSKELESFVELLWTLNESIGPIPCREQKQQLNIYIEKREEDE